jgi:hypothetical protein
MKKFRNDDQLAGFVKTRTLQGAYGRKGGAQGKNKINRSEDTNAACAGDPAKYWMSDKPTDLVFRNGMGAMRV